MTTFKKYVSLAIAFFLGAIITYLAMSLNIAKQELKSKSSQTVRETETGGKDLQPIEASNQKKEKHWFEELEEKKAAETARRIKEQESQGDELKSQFDQFKGEENE